MLTRLILSFILTGNTLVYTYYQDNDSADVAAALAIARHLGLPIFMDGMQMDDMPALREDRPEPVAAPNETPAAVPIPQAFREVIEALDITDPLEGEEPEGGNRNE